MPIFKSGFAFVGKGHIVGAQLCDGTAGGSILKIYDTDDLAFSESMIKESLAAGSAQVAYSQPIGAAPFLFQVHRGCYVQLTANAYGDAPPRLRGRAGAGRRRCRDGC